MTEPALAGRRVLVVDDEPFARSFLARVLDKLGVAVAGEAEDGVQALDMLADLGTSVDAVITDIEMPNLDGFELVRRIRFGAVDGCSRIPILVLTGRDTEHNARSARIHRISGFIVKPPTQRTVAAGLRRALRL